jgi:hypothetical protein
VVQQDSRVLLRTRRREASTQSARPLRPEDREPLLCGNHIVNSECARRDCTSRSVVTHMATECCPMPNGPP